MLNIKNISNHAFACSVLFCKVIINLLPFAQRNVCAHVAQMEKHDVRFTFINSYNQKEHIQLDLIDKILLGKAFISYNYVLFLI